MNDKRIINFEDGPNGTPQQPLGMEDLIESAQQDWKFKRRDAAFAKVLGALAFISKGTGMAMKMSELAMQEVEALKGKPPVE